MSLALLLAGSLAGPVLATSSLTWEGGGYLIELEIGEDQESTLAGLRFHAPSDATGVRLSREQIDVRVFNAAQQRLELRYAGDRTGLTPFTLEVDGDAGVLHLGGRDIAARFDWTH